MVSLEFDFDEWMHLYQSDPKEFEKRRQKIIDQEIEGIPEERREVARKLQWRIDAERRRHHSPMGALIALQKMMLDSVYGPNGLADSLNSLLEIPKRKEPCKLSPPPKNTERGEHGKQNILQFPQREG